MADFTSGFWNLYITVLTLAGVIGCALLLWSQSKVSAAAREQSTWFLDMKLYSRK